MTTWREETIGPCRLILADCMEVLPTLSGADAVVTDPPYGLGYGGSQPIGGTEGRSRARWKTWETNWDESPCSDETISAVISVAGKHVVWGGNYFRLPPSQGWLVWDKGQRGFSLADAELAWTSSDSATRVLTFTRPAALAEGDRVHPTQKPIAVMAWSVRKVSDEGETILDPFMGSGTTGVACIRTGRQFIGIEKEPKYFEIACKRIRRAWQDKQSEIKWDEPPKLKQRELEMVQ